VLCLLVPEIFGTFFSGHSGSGCEAGGMAGHSSGEKETPACRLARFVPAACSANVYLYFTSSRPQHRELALFHRAEDVRPRRPIAVLLGMQGFTS